MIDESVKSGLNHLRSVYAFFGVITLLLLCLAGLFLLIHEPGRFRYGFPEVELSEADAVEVAEASTAFREQAAMFIDAQAEWQYALGHIPGAVSIPTGTPAADARRVLATSRPNTPLIVYCGGDDCSASLDIARMLRAEVGRVNVRVLRGGLPSWQAAGGPVTSTSH